MLEKVIVLCGFVMVDGIIDMQTYDGISSELSL